MNIKRHPIHSDYGATRDGRIYSFALKRYLTTYKCGRPYNGDWYLSCRVAKKNYSVHRFACECLLGIPETKLDVNHKNGIRGDNRISNLEWCTRSENALHCFRVLKRKTSTAHTGSFGADNHSSVPVSQYTKKGKFIKKHGGFREAARTLGISRTAISLCVHGKTRAAGGFIWKKQNRAKHPNS